MLWEPLPATWPDAFPPLKMMEWSAEVVYKGKVLPRTNGRYKNSEIHCAMIPLVSAILLWKYHCWHEQWVLGSFKFRAVKKGCYSQYFAFWQYKMLYNYFNTANSNSPNPVAFMLNKITRIGACKEWDLDNDDVSFYT